MPAQQWLGKHWRWAYEMLLVIICDQVSSADVATLDGAWDASGYPN
jgi:hypothetical protein